MIEIYADTNILISYLKPKDIAHKHVKLLFQQKDIKFLSGFITVLEFECVLNILWRSKELIIDLATLKLIDSLSTYQKIRLIFEIFLKEIPIEILATSSSEQIIINEWTLNVDNIFTIAYNIAPNFSLKTLDVIQLATAFKLKVFQNRQISYFLTDDKQILNETEEIRRKIGIIPVSAKELLAALKISI